ncbi:MAG: glycosyltransferase family 2 protein [Candidatus Kryptonium sp.]|nr:glycosyltransferase family 2 protein [Candidatus Kryptonium sp.]
MYAPLSVVIPCYNGKDVIGRAILSVYEQSWRPAELIVVDDGSDKETIQILRKLKEKYGGWMKLIELGENSGGPSLPRNIGWDNATQPYVAFLDQDDIWHPKKVEIQLKFMEEHPEFSITGHDMKMWDKHGLNFDLQNFKWWEVSRAMILLKRYFFTDTVILKRDIGFRFEPTFKHFEDSYLWLNMILSGCRGAYIDLPLAFVFKPFFGYGGLSGNLWEMEKGELRAYFELSRQGKISKFVLPFLYVYSLLKFIRRVLISVKWRRNKR